MTGRRTRARDPGDPPDLRWRRRHMCRHRETADLALSAGVYGTPGTYKVESCHDTNDRR